VIEKYQSHEAVVIVITDVDFGNRMSPCLQCFIDTSDTCAADRPVGKPIVAQHNYTTAALEIPYIATKVPTDVAGHPMRYLHSHHGGPSPAAAAPAATSTIPEAAEMNPFDHPFVKGPS